MRDYNVTLSQDEIDLVLEKAAMTDRDFLQSLAEFAVGKELGLSWSPEKVDKEWPYIVRVTTDEHGGLILYDEDDDNKAVILVLARPPNFELKGWIFAREGKRREFKVD